MIQISIVRLHEYRLWTRLLGYDREHIIQSIQARAYYILQKAFSKRNAFIHHLRYDYYIAITNNIGIDEHREIFHEVNGELPTAIAISIAADKHPLLACRKATQILQKHRAPGIYMDSIANGKVSFIHLDIVNSTKSFLERGLSAYEAYIIMLQVTMTLHKIMELLNGLVFYLGGDNVLLTLSPSRELKKQALTIIHHLHDNHGVSARAGIGICDIPRKALMLATKALEEARENGREVIMYEE